MKLDILAIGVHPDDIELSCSGTILKHIALGKAAGLLDLTLGELGTRGNAELRTKEATKAAEILGVKFRKQLTMRDVFFENNEAHQRLIIEQIRLYRPEIILCNALNDRHPDHGRAAKLVADACFYSGLQKIETTYDDKKQICWRPKAVYHYIQDNYIHPDFVIDISDFMDTKMEAIKSFSSQFYNPDSKESETPISGMDFLESVKSKNAIFGRAIGVKYAEGFKTSRYIGVNNLSDLI